MLYLEKKISDKDFQTISDELLNDEDQLNHIIELAKIKSYIEAESNKILFSSIEDRWNFVCAGVVYFLEEKELSFRGQEQVYCYKYSFFNLIITIIRNHGNIWGVHIDNQNSESSYSIIDNKGQLINSKKNNDMQYVQFPTSGNYYLLLKNKLATKILEINI